jgi:hypothetical protein
MLHNWYDVPSAISVEDKPPSVIASSKLSPNEFSSPDPDS